MVTLNTLLLVGLIAAVLAGVATVGLFLLIGIYLNGKEVRALVAKVKEEEDEGEVVSIPMSMLAGAGRGITQADINEARARWAAQAQASGAPGVPGAPEGGEKKEYEPGKGAYL